MKRIAFAALAVSFAASAVQPNSPSITTQLDVAPVSQTNLSAWSVFAGKATLGVSRVATPDGSITFEFTATAAGTVTAQTGLHHVLDVRAFDTFSFWSAATATHIGDFVYLVDSQGRRRWYPLVLNGARGFTRPAYAIDAFTGQDPGFDLTAITFIRFSQAGQQVGDKLRFGGLVFEHNAYNHGDSASVWYNDIGTGPLTVVNDGAEGSPTSIKAVIQASANGQADIAINLLAPRITWDWSGKSFITFYYKDSNPNVSHYFLIYDSKLNYRQWTFQNVAPGSWMKITANLSGGFYAQSAPIDLSHIIYFETGVFAGTPNAQYTFQVDELSAY
jgi:hypothetical protein